MPDVPKKRSFGGACLIVLGLALSSAGATEAPQDAESAASKNQETAEPAKVIALRIGEELWRFAPAADGVGIDVAVESQGGQTIEMKLGVDPPIGKVVDLVAKGRELESGWSIVGLGVAAQGEDSGGIEYHMYAHVRYPGQPDKDRQWAPVGPLITRPADDPFEAMAIGLPGGDSIYLSLQDLTRSNGGSDRVESHLFVNHCPSSSAKLNRGITSHHQTTTTQPFNPVQPLQAPP